MAVDIVSEIKKIHNPSGKIEFVIADNVYADGDERLLRIALENLFNNAAKFTMVKPRPRIEFAAKTENGRIVYFVKDNGAGFDMAYANKLFKPFQRLHNTTDFPGTGIGLTTVHRIIRRHDGDIWAEAKVNEGATFYFTLGVKK